MVLLKEIQQLDMPTSVALGLFDGVHRGHQEVLKAAVDEKNSGLTAVAFTFEYDSDIIPKSKNSLTILSNEQKYELIERTGVDIIVSPKFGEISSIEAKDFFEKILIKKLNAKAITCGFDYKFGKNATGNIAMLKKLCEENDIALNVMEKQTLDGEKISSSAIKAELSCGNINRVNDLLGFRYYVSLLVEHGAQLGRQLGFPTINQHMEVGRIVPKNGVYYTNTTIGEKLYKSVTNVGVKPTIDGERMPMIETHIIGFDGDLYDTVVRVEFIDFLRDEKKFNSLDELIGAINKDKLTVDDK